MSDSDLYDHDFHAWANGRAALLRAGKLSGADVGHIAEEIESMGAASGLSAGISPWTGLARATSARPATAADKVLVKTRS